MNSQQTRPQDQEPQEPQRFAQQPQPGQDEEEE